MKHWLIQSSGLRRTDEMTLKLIRELEDSGSTWCDFGLIPFTTEVTNWENFPEADAYFLHGSTKALRVFTEGKVPATEIFVGATEEHAEKLLARVRKGIFYDADRFDMSQYLPEIRRHALNGRGEIMKLHELMDRSFSTPKFVKPGRDLKIFNGAVIEANTKFSDYIGTTQHDSYFNESMDENVIVADPVNILAEWRFFIVGHHVAAASQYKYFDKVKPSAYVPHHIKEAAKKMMNNYRPAKCFTMDLALTDTFDLRIVEFNCINCSGVYAANVSDLAFELRWA